MEIFPGPGRTSTAQRCRLHSLLNKFDVAIHTRCLNPCLCIIRLRFPQLWPEGDTSTLPLKGIDEDELVEFVSIRVHCCATNVYLEVKLVVLPLDVLVKVRYCNASFHLLFKKSLGWIFFLRTQAHKCWRYILLSAHVLMNLLKGS